MTKCSKAIKKSIFGGILSHGSVAAKQIQPTSIQKVLYADPGDPRFRRPPNDTEGEINARHNENSEAIERLYV